MFDSNVLVSALLTKGTPPDQLYYRAWANGRFDLVTSHWQIDELKRVLGYEFTIKCTVHEKIQKKERIRIVEKIRSLSSDPHPAGSKKLSGQEKYSIRQGSCRILYQIINDELVINVINVVKAFAGAASSASSCWFERKITST